MYIFLFPTPLLPATPGIQFFLEQFLVLCLRGSCSICFLCPVYLRLTPCPWGMSTLLHPAELPFFRWFVFQCVYTRSIFSSVHRDSFPYVGCCKWCSRGHGSAEEIMHMNLSDKYPKMELMDHTAILFFKFLRALQCLAHLVLLWHRLGNLVFKRLFLLILQTRNSKVEGQDTERQDSGLTTLDPWWSGGIHAEGPSWPKGLLFNPVLKLTVG